MFTTELNRFLTAKDIRNKYTNLPPLLYDELISILAVTHHTKDGVPIYLESIVDKTLHDLVVGVIARNEAKAGQDGPAQPDRFVVHGVEYKGFTPFQMRMIGFLWGKGGQKIVLAQSSSGILQPGFV